MCFFTVVEQSSVPIGLLSLQGDHSDWMDGVGTTYREDDYVTFFSVRLTGKSCTLRWRLVFLERYLSRYRRPRLAPRVLRTAWPIRIANR